MGFGKVAIATMTFACTALLSVGWSEQRGVSLSIESAQARIGRPLTPFSVAGVARRQYRRAAYGYGYGAGLVGAGVSAAAIGTAAAAATSPDGRRCFRATTPAITAPMVTAATLMVTSAYLEGRCCFRVTTAGKLAFYFPQALNRCCSAGPIFFWAHPRDRPYQAGGFSFKASRPPISRRSSEILN